MFARPWMGISVGGGTRGYDKDIGVGFLELAREILHVQVFAPLSLG